MYACFTLSILVSDCVIRELLLGEFTIDTCTHGGPIFMIIFFLGIFHYRFTKAEKQWCRRQRRGRKPGEL